MDRLTPNDLRKAVQSLSREDLVNLVTDIARWFWLVGDNSRGTLDFEQEVGGADTVEHILELLSLSGLDEAQIRTFLCKEGTIG